MKRKSTSRFKVDKLLIYLSIFTLLILSNAAVAQELQVSGNIRDKADNFPLPGVSVMVKGAGRGTVSDLDGNYTIKAKKGDVLVFSFIGMKEQSLKVKSNTLNVAMETDMEVLDEVVAIGYGTVKKKELTGAVAQVKSDDLTRVVTADVGNALQGLVAGVNVTSSSGAPGEASNILIRGVSSIDGANTPLFVVDGVPQEGDPQLSPSEIETIDVLKDAASCAIYGTRGAAGVILITTKKGKEGTLKVRLNATYGVQDIRSGTPTMNAQEQTYADFVHYRNLADTKDDEMNLPFLRSPYYYQNDTDLSDLVFQDYAPVQNYNVNISGGSKDISYSVMMGYYGKDGIISNSDYDRFNTRVNTQYKNGKWTVNASFNLMYEMVQRAPAGIITQTIKYQPTMEMIDPNDTAPKETEHGDEMERYNWVMASFNDTDDETKLTAGASFNIQYEIFKGLSFSSRGGFNAKTSNRHRFHPYQEIKNLQTGSSTDPIKDSYIVDQNSLNTSFTWDAGLTYNKKFADHHNLTLFAGQSMEQYTYQSIYAKKVGVTNNAINVIDGAYANPLVTSENNNYVNKLLGSIGRVQYGYKGKYLVSASIRRDGSSKFAAENRFGIFPSASAAWNISDEGFWKPFKHVANSVKLRGSYGTVGNQSFKPYSYAAGIATGLDYAFGNDLNYGYSQASFANGDVKWETSIQSNVGIDMAFWKNKFTVTAEYYNTSKKDMLMPIPLPGSTGAIPNIGMNHDKVSTVYLNVGDMTNQGMELALGYKTRTGKVDWRFGGTFSTNSNVVTKVNGLGGFTLLDDSGLISGKKAYSQVTALAEGYEAGSFFIYKTDGVIKTQEDLEKYQEIKADAKLGDLKYVDTNNDGNITETDRVYAGSGLPDYEIGFTTNAKYKTWDFSMQWYSAIGHEIMNGAKATAYGWGRHKDLLYQWSEAYPDSDIPAYRGLPGNHTNYNGDTDLWLEDGSYLRLKQVTLGYTIPYKKTQKYGLDRLRFYASCQNPLTITNYEGYDPEVGGNVKTRGLDKGNYPVTSMYTLGINVNF